MGSLKEDLKKLAVEDERLLSEVKRKLRMNRFILETQTTLERFGRLNFKQRSVLNTLLEAPKTLHKNPYFSEVANRYDDYKDCYE